VQVIALVFILSIPHDLCNESPFMVLLGIFEQHPVTCCWSCEQLDRPCWERINGAWIVLIIFVSLGVDL
jgi:hypothetical protein